MIDFGLFYMFNFFSEFEWGIFCALNERMVFAFVIFAYLALSPNLDIAVFPQIWTNKGVVLD